MQQLELHSCNVEFRGDDSQRVQNAFDKAKPGKQVHLKEYVVTPGKNQGKIVNRRKKKKDDGRKKSKEDVKDDQGSIGDTYLLV